MSVFTGKEKLKLGFGLMRLPKNDDGSINIEETSQMVDLFMEAGGTYFDTAYFYEGSEEAIRKALVDRYPRDSYALASKCFIPPDGSIDEKQAKQEIYISLERSNAQYFDYYLVHAIQRTNYLKYEEYGIWDYVKELKEKGLVKHWGFSFHGDPELLIELLEKHPDAEFVQLQINYADWNNPKIESRACYEVARKHNKPIVVMEPVKGGALANPIDDVKKIFKDANPDASYASWAIRYVASLDGILTVLSGMSSLEQMQDNLSYMKDFKPLDENEKEVINKVRQTLSGIESIECTACRYCTEGCPMNIPIPDIFDVRNQQLRLNIEDKRAKNSYNFQTSNKGKASECIECGQCESQCPQHLSIIELLKECALNLE